MVIASEFLACMYECLFVECSLATKSLNLNNYIVEWVEVIIRLSGVLAILCERLGSCLATECLIMGGGSELLVIIYIAFPGLSACCSF